MRMTIKYLQSRKGHLRYRRKVPAHLREYLGGRSEIVQSLGLSTGQEAHAVHRIQLIDRDVSKLLLEAERAHRADADPHAMAAAAEAWALENKFIGPDRSGLMHGTSPESDYDLWVDRLLRKYPGKEPELQELEPMERMKIETVKRGGRVPVPLTIGRAAEAYGTHQQGGELKKAEATALAQLYAWIQSVANLRSQAKGKPEFLPLSKISRASARDFIAHLHEDRGQGASTITRRINSLKAIWTFAADHFDEPTISNPWARQKPPVAAKGGHVAAHERLPFNRGHLALIDARLRSNSIDPNARTIMRLLRVTGCRPMEIGGLTKADVFLDEPTPWIWIRPNAVRRLKNKASERRIPLVPEVVGDLRALSEIAECPDQPLFPKEFQNTTGLSYRLNAVLKAAGIPNSRRLVAYSFRHTIAEALRVSGAPDFHAKAIMGHADQSMAGRYGAGGVDLSALLGSLQSAIERIGEVPEHVYRAEELVSL